MPLVAQARHHPEDEMGTRIQINGREYSSPDEMPPDDRRLYDMAMNLPAAQANGGTSEATPLPHKPGFHIESHFNTRLVVNSKTYGSLDEVPPAARVQIERVLKLPQGEAATAAREAMQQIQVSSESAKPLEPTGGSGIRGVLIAAAVIAALGLAAWLMLGHGGRIR